MGHQCDEPGGRQRAISDRCLDKSRRRRAGSTREERGLTCRPIIFLVWGFRIRSEVRVFFAHVRLGEPHSAKQVVSMAPASFHWIVRLRAAKRL